MHTQASRAAWVGATALALAAAGAALVGPVHIPLGPLTIAARDPSRTAFQAALAACAATLLTARWAMSRWAIVMAVAAVLATAVADSRPRGIGDGAEYLAMALNLARGRAPALSPDDLSDAESRLAHTPGFERMSIAQPLVGADGRQDFPHFWLYSAVVAPVLVAVEWLGAHPNHAFTVVNAALLLAFVWCAPVGHGRMAAALVAAGPLVWWVDKAHAEVFLFVLIGLAVWYARRQPALALMAAALAGAQNPAATLVLAAVALVAATRTARTRTTWMALGAAGLVACVHPAYYLWHLGMPSPLAGGMSQQLPGLRALLTPLADPNLGLMVYAPALVAVAAVGAVAGRLSAAWPVALAAALLVLFGSVPNINHGGTPGVSRYALWILACSLPLVEAGLRSLDEHRPAAVTAVVAVTMATTWVVFRPALASDGVSPSALAAALWARAPGVDNPVPEVFAERVTGVDGRVPVPAAVGGCRKVLVRGDGVEAWWPFPCAPAAAPPSCTSDGALCYVNDGGFARAPAQPGFGFDPAPDMSWTSRQPGRLVELRDRLGPPLTTVRLGRARAVAGGDGLNILRIVEGTAATAVWLSAVPGLRALLWLRSDGPLRVEVQDAATGMVMRRQDLPAGRHDVPCSFDQRILVIVESAP